MSCFNPKFPFGENFTTDNDRQVGLQSPFDEFACDEFPPQEDDLLSAFRESMSASNLVYPEIAKKQSIYGTVETHKQL